MKVLLVTGIEGAANCAAALKGMLGMDFDVAGGRRAAISALKHTEYAAVVVDEALVDADPAGAAARALLRQAEGEIAPGVLLLTVPAGALAAAAGLAKDDVIVAANGKPVATMDALQPVQAAALALTIMRNQKTLTVTVPTPVAPNTASLPPVHTVPLQLLELVFQMKSPAPLSQVCELAWASPHAPERMRRARTPTAMVSFFGIWLFLGRCTTAVQVLRHRILFGVPAIYLVVRNMPSRKRGALYLKGPGRRTGSTRPASRVCGMDEAGENPQNVPNKPEPMPARKLFCGP